MTSISYPWVYVYQALTFPTWTEIRTIEELLKTDRKNVIFYICSKDSPKDFLEIKRFDELWRDVVRLYLKNKFLNIEIRVDGNQRNFDPIEQNINEGGRGLFLGVNLWYFKYINTGNMNLVIVLPEDYKIDKKELEFKDEFNAIFSYMIKEIKISRISKETENKIKLHQDKFITFLQNATYYWNNILDQFIPNDRETVLLYFKYAPTFPTNKYLMVLSLHDQNHPLWSIQYSLLSKLMNSVNFTRMVFILSPTKQGIVKMIFGNENNDKIKTIYTENVSGECENYMDVRGHILWTLFEMIDYKRDSKNNISYPPTQLPLISDRLSLTQAFHVKKQIYGLCQK